MFLYGVGGKVVSKFNLKISYKNICILKHSLRKRIEADEQDYKMLIDLRDTGMVTEKGELFIKEHEEHIRCMEALKEELERIGYMHGRNIFEK